MACGLSLENSLNKFFMVVHLPIIRINYTLLTVCTKNCIAAKLVAKLQKWNKFLIKLITRCILTNVPI